MNSPANKTDPPPFGYLKRKPGGGLGQTDRLSVGNKDGARDLNMSARDRYNCEQDQVETRCKERGKEETAYGLTV